jgi:hypothetical protein
MRGGHETKDFSAIYEFAMGDNGKGGSAAPSGDGKEQTAQP